MIGFDEIAENYPEKVEEGMILPGSDHDYFNEYKMYYLKKFFRGMSRLKILDYGCGVGLLSKKLIDTFPMAVVHGFDVSTESIRDVPDALKSGKNRFTSDLAELDTDYDAAILSTVLHHVTPHERLGVMRGVHERLARGGVVIIIEHNMMNPLTRKSVDACEFDRDAVMLTPKETRALLSEAGFFEISSRYITFFPKQLASLRLLDHFISWLPLGAQFMTTAKK